MNEYEQAIADLDEWVSETGRRLPRVAEAIIAVEGDCVVDLVSGDIELITDDWVVFAAIWRREAERRHKGVHYCQLAVALRKADTGRTLARSDEWSDYLALAKQLVEVRDGAT